jgi:hypothetical protein
MGSGSRLALLYGSFSAVARSYLAYGAYRADVMLRETVVVGLVGATGLGSLLLESLTAFAWDQLLALVVVYATLTLLGEELSDRLRHRLLGSTRAPHHLSKVLTDVSVDRFKMGESAQSARVSPERPATSP